MNFFQFLDLGLWHIADINAYDHILFIVVTCAMFPIRAWKKILLLITAFTIGHSLTLALAALKFVKVNADFIELLIPITILLTGLWNIFATKNSHSPLEKLPFFNYIIVLLFGLIHGLGFSNYLGMLLGKNANIVPALLGFNIGVEIGQILIVLIFMVISFLFLNIIKVKMKYWTISVSLIAILVSIHLITEIV